ncbi:MAG: ATP-binding cassette domain-containing protein [Treponema sp.]|jgi:peptide/nickel transport system ATP-binding protein|nr:ATP-binding cassette domain-containing protein [Treponema sp.]
MRLEANNIGFRYGRNDWLFRNLSLVVNSGERVGLVAPSGWGKSTLVKLLSGYEKPLEGEVLLDGKPLPAKGVLPVQLIYQHPEDAINPRWRMRQVLAEAGIESAALSDALGIERAWLNRFPRELSGGELQRFCVARALFSGACFLLADEISTMLDSITQAQLWHFLLAEVERRNMGLIVVTHNPALAARVCSKVRNINSATTVLTTP